MPHDSIPLEYAGWWRITATSAWSVKHLDMLGAALISFGTGRGDRLRVIAILADVNARFVRNGVSFTWAGASEFDPIAGTGRARLGKDGRLKGTLVITGGDKSTFVAERSEEPSQPIPDPPSYHEKWRRW
jgi:hypothetical protein